MAVNLLSGNIIQDIINALVAGYAAIKGLWPVIKTLIDAIRGK